MAQRVKIYTCFRIAFYINFRIANIFMAKCLDGLNQGKYI